MLDACMLYRVWRQKWLSFPSDQWQKSSEKIFSFLALKFCLLEKNPNNNIFWSEYIRTNQNDSNQIIRMKNNEIEGLKSNFSPALCFLVFSGFCQLPLVLQIISACCNLCPYLRNVFQLSLVFSWEHLSKLSFSFLEHRVQQHSMSAACGLATNFSNHEQKNEKHCLSRRLYLELWINLAKEHTHFYLKKEKKKRKHYLLREENQ